MSGKTRLERCLGGIGTVGQSRILEFSEDEIVQASVILAERMGNKYRMPFIQGMILAQTVIKEAQQEEECTG